MASQKYIFNILLFVVGCLILAVSSSPVPNDEETLGDREGRFYGASGSQASAMASSGATGGFGFPGLGFGGSSAQASAQSSSLGFGGFGK